jgi:hypothetical protein
VGAIRLLGGRALSSFLCTFDLFFSFLPFSYNFVWDAWLVVGLIDIGVRWGAFGEKRLGRSLLGRLRRGGDGARPSVCLFDCTEGRDTCIIDHTSILYFNIT